MRVGVRSREEVRTLIERTVNLEHRTMLTPAYSLGLRLNEVLTLRLQAIDSRRMMLRIGGQKGRQDRDRALSGSLLLLIQEQCQQDRPQTCLFEGTKPGEHYGERSLQHIVRQAAVRAGILRPVSLYTLRHSCATHLLEAGIDLRHIQESATGPGRGSAELRFTASAASSKPSLAISSDP